jgi:RNA 2',3'-cyclic 3'-phosphodiesterase
VSTLSLRLFFALWPDVVTRSALASLARVTVAVTGGRAVAPENLHLTLAFLGERPATMVPDLCALASEIDVTPFTLLLDDLGYWRKTGIAWLSTGKRAPELLVLRERMVAALATLRIVIDERRFMPHVTLARRVESTLARRLAPPIDWNVDSFALVTSTLDRGGVRYEVLRTWPPAALGALHAREGGL